MSLGIFTAWRALQTKKKKCERCGFYFDQALNDCSHCARLDDQALQKLIENHHREMEGNANLGKKFLLISLIAGIILLIVIVS